MSTEKVIFLQSLGSWKSSMSLKWNDAYQIWLMFVLKLVIQVVATARMQWRCGNQKTRLGLCNLLLSLGKRGAALVNSEEYPISVSAHARGKSIYSAVALDQRWLKIKTRLRSLVQRLEMSVRYFCPLSFSETYTELKFSLYNNKFGLFISGFSIIWLIKLTNYIGCFIFYGYCIIFLFYIIICQYA